MEIFPAPQTSQVHIHSKLERAPQGSMVMEGFSRMENWAMRSWGWNLHDGCKILSTLYHFEFSLITAVFAFFFGKYCPKLFKKISPLSTPPLPLPRSHSYSHFLTIFCVLFNCPLHSLVSISATFIFKKLGLLAHHFILFFLLSWVDFWV